MISRPSHRYEEIANQLREEIERGSFGLDGRLPSERRLMLTFDVQRNTVRQALGLLEREGKITTVSKSGWFVANAPRTIPTRTAVVESLTGRNVLLVTFRHRTLPTFDTLAFGLYEVLSEAGVSVLRYDSAPTKTTESQIIDTLEYLPEIEAAGVVIWPQSLVDVKVLAKLESRRPLVIIDRRVFGFECDSVRFDDFMGGRLVTEHLIAQGHRHIAFLADEPFVETVQNRWRGYRIALERAGLGADDRYTALTMGSHEPNFSSGIKQLLHGPPTPPTAFVCSNDGVASKLLLYLRSIGKEVPKDIAVTGYGNEASSYLDLMGLTSVDQSFIDLGRAAGKLLIERMEQTTPRTPHDSKDIVIPVTLVPRESTATNR